MLVAGGVLGLVISAGVLTLLWFGVAGALSVGNTDLKDVLWPSWVMLVMGGTRHFEAS